MNEAQLDKQPKVPAKIDLPTDENLQRRLVAKLEEYEGREKPYAGHYNAPDSPIARSVNRDVMKEVLLKIVITQGTITYEEFKEHIREKYQNLSTIEDDIKMAFEIISDYCLTGGKNLAGGTGLVELNKSEELPDVITLPEDEESRRRLARMLEIYETRGGALKEEESSMIASINKYKEIILGTLLANGTFDIEDFLRTAEYSEGFDEEAAHEAIRLIAANCNHGLGDSYEA